MLWVKLVSDAGQRVIAKMNLRQFTFAIHKCILAHVAMKNFAKWTDVRVTTLLFKQTCLPWWKRNLRKCLPKAGESCSCWTGQVVLVARVLSHFLQKRTLEERERVRGDSFWASPSAPDQGAAKTRPLSWAEGRPWGSVTLPCSRRQRVKHRGYHEKFLALTQNWNMRKLSKILKHFRLN